MTHHLPVAKDYLEQKNPKWFVDVKGKLQSIEAECPIKQRNHEQFLWLMGYLQKKENPTYDVPQLKDEVNTSDFENYMVNNSLLAKKR